jgi:hypothetical protein
MPRHRSTTASCGKRLVLFGPLAHALGGHHHQLIDLTRLDLENPQAMGSDRTGGARIRATARDRGHRDVHLDTQEPRLTGDRPLYHTRSKRRRR